VGPASFNGSSSDMTSCGTTGLTSNSSLTVEAWGNWAGSETAGPESLLTGRITPICDLDHILLGRSALDSAKYKSLVQAPALPADDIGA